MGTRYFGEIPLLEVSLVERDEQEILDGIYLDPDPEFELASVCLHEIRRNSLFETKDYIADSFRHATENDLIGVGYE